MKDKKYFTNPPKPKTIDVPLFLKTHGYNVQLDLGTEYLISLMRWAEKEYADSISFYTISGNEYMLNVLRKRNFIYLLARTDEFREVVKNMDSETWGKIPKAVREIIVLTKNEYDVFMSRQVRGEK